jgi:hypothetical protein
MNQIIALWCHPRSLSTAMERAMRERGEFRIFHEPFMYLYYVHDQKRAMPHFDVDADHPASYEDTKRWILEAAEEKPVFFKDMSYYVMDYLPGDPDFVSALTHTFLIRDPARSIASYYKLDPEVTCEEIGLELQYRHFSLVAEATGRAPVVVYAGDLQENPENTMRAYCRALGLDYKPEALQWSERTPKEWKNVAGWHKDVLDSTGIKKDRASPMVDIDSDPRLRDYYEYHRPYYEALYKHRLIPDAG